MFQPVKECVIKLQRNGEGRVVAIPEDFVLVGEDIIIRQEKDGVITIYPNSPEGRKALDLFNPV